MGRGDESLIVKSRSHDQDGRHNHIWLQPLNQRTIGPENAHLKPDLGVLSHNEMTLTLNTHTP